MIEFQVLAAAPADDARAAIERLADVGPVIMLVPDGAALAAARYLPDGLTNVTAVAWASLSAPRPGTVDRPTVARLREIQKGHNANWLLATEHSLAAARACPGLKVVCVGPPGPEQGPTRPDHRAHSLLEAIRFIETSETFG